MTRKRFIKLLMSTPMERDTARFFAGEVAYWGGSYNSYYRKLCEIFLDARREVTKLKGQ